MNAVRVKICGITRKEDLAVAAGAGADAVGFVVDVASSSRNISVTEAEILIRQVPPFVKSVIVTVPTNVEEIVKTCDKLNPDAVQIHGWNLLDVGAVREKLPNMLLIGSVKADITNGIDRATRAARMFDAVLLDSFANGRYGGTGIVNDWELSKRIKHAIHSKPLILAGGLTPKNVAEAVRTVQPYAVDVSSGVELHPGIKNHRKIMEFIKNAKDARI